jgi:hypothetical protein
MKVTKAEIAALAFALLPFIVRIGDRAVDTVNGVTRVKWDYNYAGVILGIASLVAIYIGLRDLKHEQPPQPPMQHYVLCGAIGLLALYQIAKGAFLI